MGKKIKAKN
jgi:hypothetical protein